MKLTREEAWALEDIYRNHDVDYTHGTIRRIFDAIGVKYEVSGNVMSIKILEESINAESDQSSYENFEWEDDAE